MRFCKRIWEQHNGFLIISEVYNDNMEAAPEINIIKSGPIPRVYFMPIYFSSIFGKKLHMYWGLGDFMAYILG